MPEEPKVRNHRKAVKSSCLSCKKEILVTPKRLEKGRGKYCSKECRSEHKKLTFHCARCGKECVDYVSRSDRKKYCSKECQIQYLFIENKREGIYHYNFQGFKHPNTYRKMAFLLHGKICANCGSTSKLHVHHVDHNHENNPIDGTNWQVLCEDCHLHHHGIVKSLVAENKLYTCPNCDKDFRPRNKRSKFCSKSCSATFHHRIRRERHL